MKSDWVAATVRARSMAQRRVGAGGAQRIARAPNLTEALGLLTESVYGPHLAGTDSLADTEHAVRATILWQIRVLAGWMPQSAAGLSRAFAAEYEAENIVALAVSLADGRPIRAPFELGSLATAWRRARSAETLEDLSASLRTSSWGDVGAHPFRDALTLVRFERLGARAAAARPWARAAAGLAVARVTLVDDDDASPQFRRIAARLVGRRWEQARTAEELRDALPPGARDALAGVTGADDLWRAEALFFARMETDGFRLLRGPLAGADVVLGAVAVLKADAWRVNAALAAAALGLGGSEVLDAVA
ncbi:MAG TPA: V-type ATPase subunit [Actinomycetaceae bacterium]|nr:V-type ATPase subunit [Actinomycetaceae bacterium]